MCVFVCASMHINRLVSLTHVAAEASSQASTRPRRSLSQLSHHLIAAQGLAEKVLAEKSARRQANLGACRLLAPVQVLTSYRLFRLSIAPRHPGEMHKGSPVWSHVSVRLEQKISNVISASTLTPELWFSTVEVSGDVNN